MDLSNISPWLKPEITETIVSNQAFLEQLGVDLDGLIDCGGVGCVFKLMDTDNFVAKISDSPGELKYYEVASFAGLSMFPEILFVERLPLQLYGRREWYIVGREAVIPFGNESQDFPSEIIADLEFVIDIFRRHPDNKYLDIESLLHTFKLMSPVVERFAKDLCSLIKYFRPRRVPIDDIKLPNLGLSVIDGRLILFDAIYWER